MSGLLKFEFDFFDTDCLSDRGLSIPEAKECVKDRREWRVGDVLLGSDVDDPG